MEKLSLTLPGQASPIPTPLGLGSKGIAFNNLSDFVNTAFNVIIYVCVFLAFYYLVWGAYQYILADGKKENLAKARARITWALIGLITILLAYFISRYATEAFILKPGAIPF